MKSLPRAATPAQLKRMCGVRFMKLTNGNSMKRSVLVCVASVTLALTAGAQLPYNHRNAPRRTTYAGYRSTSAVRHMPAQRAFSNARYRQPAVSTARPREPAFRTTSTQPRMNAPFANRPGITSDAAWRRTPMPPRHDSEAANRRYSLGESRFNPRQRPSDAFANRSARTDLVTRPQTRLPNRSDWGDPNFRHRQRPSRSFANSEGVDRRQTRQSFKDYWANSNVRERLRANNSFANRPQSTSFWSGTRTGFSHNWKGAQFEGRQYWAFRDYQSQWHDSGWWRHNCDRIVFVTVYSQSFPFFFDAGYWYPCWGYYPESYYPCDGPIYGYNGLPPDEIISNVQTELYNEGYYDGPIDGILGPDTQAAIADYQADHGLPVTAAIDEPTAVSLGLT
jgi:hypothetical protein